MDEKMRLPLALITVGVVCGVAWVAVALPEGEPDWLAVLLLWVSLGAIALGAGWLAAVRRGRSQSE